MTARIVLLNLALWALTSYATLQLIHTGLVDVLGPVNPPSPALERYAQELEERRLRQPAVRVYEEMLRGVRLGAERRARIHFKIGQLLEEDPDSLDEAIAHYLRVTYLVGGSDIYYRARKKVDELTRRHEAAHPPPPGQAAR